MEELKKKLLERMSEEELNKKIKEKIEEFEGLISEESAIYYIASELGISDDLNDNEEYIFGRIKKIFPYKWFEKDGKRGRFARIIFIDNNENEKTLVLWHRESEKADKLRINDIIRIKKEDVYEKDGEYHLKYGGTIEKLEDGSINIPEIKENIKRLFDLTEDDKDFSCYCKILSVYPKRENYRRLLVYDGIPMYLTIFGRFSNYNFKPGTIVKLENCNVFKNKNGELELSLGEDGRVLFDKPSFEIEEIFVRKNIKDLVKNGFYEIKGIVTWIEKEVPLVFSVDDGTGHIRCVYFDEFNLIKGKEYLLKGKTKENNEYLDFIVSRIENVDYKKELKKF